MPKQTARQKREARNTQLRALGSFGASSQGSFREAFQLFLSGDEGQRIKAEGIAFELLRFPELGDLHRAGCHIICAHGIEDYV